MIQFSVGKSSALLALMVVGITAGATTQSSAQGLKARFLEQSLASQLVQQMAQRRIYEADDKVDAACKEKQFLQAAVVQEPAVSRSGSVDMRNWQEDWTLNRCGQNVAYRVFYSEIGKGGVTVSIAAHDSLVAPPPSVVALAKA